MTLNQYKDVLSKCGFVVDEGRSKNESFYLGCFDISSYEDNIISIYSVIDEEARIYTEVSFDESKGNICANKVKAIKDDVELLEICKKMSKVYKEIEIRRKLLEMEKDFKNE